MKVVHFEQSSYDVYIGDHSIWGNPFVVGTDGTIAEVIEKYEKYITKQPWFIDEMAGLQQQESDLGRELILGCSCIPPCYGDVLCKYGEKFLYEDINIERAITY